MRTNTKTQHTEATYEGGTASSRQSALQALERAVSTCLLWEPSYYETGDETAGRIVELCAQVAPDELAGLALRARTDLKLRHVPQLLACELAKRTDVRGTAAAALIGVTLAGVIQRPDELAEFLALYWREGRRPLSKQVKNGLAVAFGKFNGYQLAKWNRDGAVKLRDVLFLCHAKPRDAEQAALWKQLVEGTLPAADTWEVALSSGADKRETFERLLLAKRLGYMALLQNLRNMVDAKVDPAIVRLALAEGARKSKALPFRFVAAAKAAPSYARDLSDAMLVAVPDELRLDGETAVVVDVSGSMDDPLSSRSTLNRLEAAGALAVLLAEVSRARVFTFSERLVEVANHRGLALIEAIGRSQERGGTYLGRSLKQLQKQMPSLERIIVPGRSPLSSWSSVRWRRRCAFGACRRRTRTRRAGRTTSCRATSPASSAGRSGTGRSRASCSAR